MRVGRILIGIATVVLSSRGAAAQSGLFTTVFSEAKLPSPPVAALAGHFWDSSLLDLLVITEDKRMFCFPGKGDGTFGTPSVTNVSDAVTPAPVFIFGALRSVAVGQQVFAGDGFCGFTLRQTLPFNASASGYFGGIFGSGSGLAGSIPGTAQFRTMYSTQAGTFESGSATTLEGSHPRSISQTFDYIAELEGAGSQVWLQDGKGGLKRGQTLAGVEWSRFLAAGDVNGDSKIDLLFDQGNIVLGRGDGGYVLTPQSSGCGGSGPAPCGGVLADFDLDGFSDALLASYDAASGSFEVTLRRGTALGLGSPQPTQIRTEVLDGLVVADWNGDSAPDLAVLGETSVRVYMNLAPTQAHSAAGEPYGVAPAVTPGSLASIYGVNYSTQSAVAPSLQEPPLTLAGVQLRLTDQAGGQAFAPLLYVSPQQINFVIPETIQTGWAAAELIRDGSVRKVADLTVHDVAPTLFWSAELQTTNPDGSIGWVPLDFNAVWSAPATVAFFGTGFHGSTGLNTTVQLGWNEWHPLTILPAPGLLGVEMIVVEVRPEIVDHGNLEYGGALVMKSQGVQTNLIYTGFY